MKLIKLAVIAVSMITMAQTASAGTGPMQKGEYREGTVACTENATKGELAKANDSSSPNRYDHRDPATAVGAQ